MRKSDLEERGAQVKQFLRTTKLNKPVLRQTADNVPEFQDPQVWLQSKCHIMSPQEY